jgi:hypothetical protein
MSIEMPPFRRADPDLRQLIAYIVARARAREITLNRTKLVKLLYLLDIERVKTGRDPITGLEWVFFHYGPYAFELIDTLKAMEGSQLVAQQWHTGILYRGAPGAPDGDEWPAGTKAAIDRVVDRFAELDLNELLDYVYFRTGPMQQGKRGDRLDMALAREDPPLRAPRPLEPPERPDDVDARLAAWRVGTARRLSPVTLDPPGVMLGEDAGEPPHPGVRGQLRVPDGSDL